MLMPRLSHGMGMAMDGLTTVATGMERDLLMLSQPQMLMLKLSHGMATMDGPTTVATGTERDLQTLNQLQLLMPSLSHGGTDTTDTLGHTTVTTGVKLAKNTPTGNLR